MLVDSDLPKPLLMPQEKIPPQAGQGTSRTNATPRFLIYRSGNATPVNMTPRPTDVDGLSAFRDIPSTEGKKYQIIDTMKLTNLHAFCDDDSTGHFCIAPHDMSKMQEWIQTRGKCTHPFTEELLNAIVAEHRT